MSDAHAGAPGTVRLLRRALVLLAALGLVGTAVELALLRHWGSATRVIPWVALAALAAGVVLLAVRPQRGTVLAVRALAVAGVLSALVGVYEHVAANHGAGPLDLRYADAWATMSALSRWWAALTNSVGPSPVVAPAVLAQVALCLLFATVHHPALRVPDGSRGPSVMPPSPVA
ncbi:MAG: hypothetical protein M5U14_15245 [Acidimicrobiia bacterium]|nr:hypothetical protein [Acidimicrobiia bacterium]